MVWRRGGHGNSRGKAVVKDAGILIKDVNTGSDEREAAIRERR